MVPWSNMYTGGKKPERNETNSEPRHHRGKQRISGNPPMNQMAQIRKSTLALSTVPQERDEMTRDSEAGISPSTGPIHPSSRFVLTYMGVGYASSVV
ncbi:hypothetical protein BJ165DRAFT_1484889 [Panaeolus papilionaceus]|nr:hypothetical protein BJ165DRAFT_1484889 [Panaeolus papilionaceus]